MPTLQAFNTELTALIQQVLPSAVTIEAFSKDLADDSQGSGWIYAEELIVTNYHVIRGMAHPLMVRPQGCDPLIGTLIGTDPDNDIAVLRVPGLSGVPLGIEEKQPCLGELCVAFGSPHAYRESVSLGIISGLSRQIRCSDGRVFEEMIQTDASVNPGNSGGPLVNIYGRIVGMNTMGPAETVNMAIPAETLAVVVPEIEAYGSVIRATIGISISLVCRREESTLNQAICIRKVKDPDQSKLKAGDLVKAINGKNLSRRIDIIRALDRSTVDQLVQVEIERDGNAMTVEVLAKAKAAAKQ